LAAAEAAAKAIQEEAEAAAAAEAEAAAAAAMASRTDEDGALNDKEVSKEEEVEGDDNDDDDEYAEGGRNDEDEDDDIPSKSLKEGNELSFADSDEIDSRIVSTDPPPVVFPSIVVPLRSPIIPVLATPSPVIATTVANDDAGSSLEPLLSEAPQSVSNFQEQDCETDSSTALSATGLLFGFIEFLRDGNLSLLDAPDRNDWVRAVLRMVEREKPLLVGPSTAVAGAGAADEAPVDIAAAIQALEDMNKSSDDANDSTESIIYFEFITLVYYVTDIFIDHAFSLFHFAVSDDVLRSNSWRRSLIRLKTLYPDSRPLGVSTSNKSSSGMHGRLSAMRDNLVRHVTIILHTPFILQQIKSINNNYFF
jgi:hypothetical protein